MTTAGTLFSRPRTPAAKCLHLVRLHQIVTRSELVEATGLSQPTITRAIGALVRAGLVQERNDLTRSQGRGRPTIPLELAPSQQLHAGIAVGTSTTYIGLYDLKGRTIRDADVPTPVAQLSEADFIEHVMAGLNRLTAGLDRPLASVGVTTSGRVSEDGVVDAPNLGWHGVDVAARLRYQFAVPVLVSAAVPAILGSEIQAGGLPGPGEGTPTELALFADDSIGAAVSGTHGVHQVDTLPVTAGEVLDTAGLPTEEALANAGVLHRIRDHGVELDSLPAAVAASQHNDEVRKLLDDRAVLLADVAVQLAEEHRPSTIVVAGSAFVDDPKAPKLFASAVRSRLGSAAEGVELRLIPTHREIVRAIARAVALDPLLREPLALVQEPVTAPAGRGR
ncbi:ROK family transcriptional regulator [Corynebacterium halotolerans]|uniref:Crp family regulatory protein n=1 Tax=Corynebacterium halotolerans YIM 70093 = DSM 44683 TaxID=1121362 RepID=M1NNY2_9CORY|nr:ROK family transcriptional regulator [Corynebacterium halotolerans]AGF71212.1 Crp family regulatory protein [Corynebacterium halotolerans YIM 70093 = DSM 44683]